MKQNCLTAKEHTEEEKKEIKANATQHDIDRYVDELYTAIHQNPYQLKTKF